MQVHPEVRRQGAQWLAATALLVGPLAASAASFNSLAGLGALIGSSGAFPVLCSTPTCNSGSITATAGTVASVTGGMDDGTQVFDAWATSWASSLTTQHAGAGLTVSGRSGGLEHIWFANAASLVGTVMALTPARPEDLGLATDLALNYQFDGTVSSSGSGDVALSAIGRVFASVPGQQSVDCLPDPAVPGQCTITVRGFVYGDTLDYGLMLQTVVSVIAAPGAGLAYDGAVSADFRHTLTLTGAAVFDGKTGQSLQGWTLSAPDEGLVLFTSPVPEPAAWMLMVAGLAGLLARRRYST